MKHATTLATTLAFLTCAGAAAAQTEVAILEPADGTPGDLFGWAVQLEGDWAVVGAPGADGPLPPVSAVPLSGETDAGAVYVFERTVAGWVEAQKLVASQGRARARFGSAVAVDGSWLAVGSPGARPKGSLTLFERTAAGWVERQHFTGTGGDAVALEGTRLMAGRRSLTWLAPGKVTVFERTGGGWVQVDEFDGYGGTLDLEGDRVVGGGAYDAAVYRKVGPTWQQEQYLGIGCCHNVFGWQVALQGTTVVVTDPYPGWSYLEVYEFDGVAWPLDQTHYHPEEGSFAFGMGLSLEGDRMVLGDIGAGDPPNWDEMTGAAYLYRRDVTGQWAPASKLVASDGADQDWFGWSADLEGPRVLVGAPRYYVEDAGGKAYVYEVTDVAQVSCRCDSAAPCGNDYPLGGCVGSRSLGALLGASGSASVSADDLVLSAAQLPRNQVGQVRMGGTLGAPVPMGDGLLCLGGQLFRFPPRATGPGGVFDEGPGIVAHSQGFGVGGQITAGSTWHFQVWVRDPLGPCGSGSNLTNALSVTFTP